MARFAKASAGARPICSPAQCRRTTSAPSRFCRTGRGMDRPNIIYSPQNRPVTTPPVTGYMGMSVNSIRSHLRRGLQHRGVGAVGGDQTGYQLHLRRVLGHQHADRRAVRLRQQRPRHADAVRPGHDRPRASSSSTATSAPRATHSPAPTTSTSTTCCPRRCRCWSRSPASWADWDIALLQRRHRACRGSSGASPTTRFTAAGPAQLHPQRPARAGRSHLHQPHPLAGPEPAEPRAPAADRSDGHLQLRRLGQPASAERRHRLDLPQQEGRPRRRLDRQQPDRPDRRFPLYGLPDQVRLLHLLARPLLDAEGRQFELIDQGYAMCLVDDGTGTGTKIAQYYIDTDGNYNELYTYVLYSPSGGIIETATLHAEGHARRARQPQPPRRPLRRRPNNVNPQDLVTQINKVSNLIYAAFGPSSPGQPPAYIPIQAVGSRDREMQAAPILGPPGFNGYTLNVVGSQPPAGPDLADLLRLDGIPDRRHHDDHPLQRRGPEGSAVLRLALARPGQTAHRANAATRPDGSRSSRSGLFGGDGLGALIDTPFSCGIPGIRRDSPGDRRQSDARDGDEGGRVFYTFNARRQHRSWTPPANRSTVAGTPVLRRHTDPPIRSTASSRCPSSPSTPTPTPSI